MIIGETDVKDYRPAKRRVEVSVGESVRIVRELQGLSQNQLAEKRHSSSHAVRDRKRSRSEWVLNAPKFSLARSAAIRPYWSSLAGTNQSAARPRLTIDMRPRLLDVRLRSSRFRFHAIVFGKS